MREPGYRPEHAPDGDPCHRCGLPQSRHRHRERPGKARGQKPDAATRRRRELDEPVVGIDGEGQGRAPHLYTYLSAVDEHGEKVGSVHDPRGLSSLAILEWLVGLGRRRLFGFALGYDIAMWLRDLPDRTLYELARPEFRARRDARGHVRHLPRHWRGFRLNLLRRRFTVQRVEWRDGRSVPVGVRVVVWDVFAFFQARFVKALADWRVAPEEVLERIRRMKERRSEFDLLAPEDVHRYCDSECDLLAKLVRRLVEAHERAGLPLRSFWGAGSTSSALLERLGVRDYRADPPADASPFVMRAFFGGRFEISRRGPVPSRVWSYDIASAYPYAMTFLPCLVHGRWRLVTGSPAAIRAEVRAASLAVVRARVRRSGPSCWGPLPWRAADGTITWPLRCDATWCWGAEYLAACETSWPGVEAVAAWRYDTDCSCRPFGGIPAAYAERVRIGKDGPGLALKLGINGCYGKTAQSVGAAPYRSWVWAGAITSGCRAQLLRLVSQAPESVLMVATDGILSRRRLEPPLPRDTGTGGLRDPDGELKEPLGGWECKTHVGGVFLCRPGIYWPLGASREEIRSLRSRGISRSVLAACSAEIETHYARTGGSEPYRVDRDEEGRQLSRFVGLRQGVGPGRGGEIRRLRSYADWPPWHVDISFDPRPKRAAARRDGTLECWERMPGESAPYDRARQGAEAAALRELEDVLADSADGDVAVR